MHDFKIHFILSCDSNATAKKHMTVASGTKLLTEKLLRTNYWASLELLLLEIKKISKSKSYNKSRVHFYTKKVYQ